MKTDPATANRLKGVTMTKRLTIAALVVAAVLVLAAPALAFDGYRDGYIPSNGDEPVSCQSCHAGGPGIFSVWDEWVTTTHSKADVQVSPISDGPGCAGCHSGNYDPQKAIPDTTTGLYPTTNTAGDDAFTEPFIGCSACHWGKNPGESLLGGAMHKAPLANMANPDICGQCHSRYSQSTSAYTNYDGSSATQQYTIGTFNPLGLPGTTPAWTPAPITDFLNIPTPAAPQSMVYYKDPAGDLLPWSARGHSQGATQYSEWAMEGHAGSLDALKASGDACGLKCHSGDYLLVTEWNAANPTDQKPLPTLATAKYGVTCQVCHDPHSQSDQPMVWNKTGNAQLTAPRQALCVECHTDYQLAPGETLTPGSKVVNLTPTKEMMDGVGAIGVVQGDVSVHKGGCVQCHMVPTAWTREGEAEGANHIFAIVQPETAALSISTKPISVIIDPITEATESKLRAMPMSSCSTCHAKEGDPYAMYLQDTLVSRQAQMKAWDAEVTDALTAAAARMGYGSIESANTAINAKSKATWTTSELAFQSAFTNQSFVETDRSWGIHNWDYAKTVVLKALDQAQSVLATVSDVTIECPLVTTPYGSATLVYGQSTTISGTIELPMGADSTTLLGGQVRLWFKPTSGGAFQPVQQTFLSGLAYDEYVFTVMPQRSGTYRVQFVGNDTWSPSISTQTVGLNVAYRINISRPSKTVKLNTSVKFKGSVAPLDYAPGTMVQIQRKKGDGAWKNWATVGAGSNGNYTLTKKMTATGTFRFRALFAGDAAHLGGTSNTVKVVVKR